MSPSQVRIGHHQPIAVVAVSSRRLNVTVCITLGPSEAAPNQPPLLRPPFRRPNGGSEDGFQMASMGDAATWPNQPPTPRPKPPVHDPMASTGQAPGKHLEIRPIPWRDWHHLPRTDHQMPHCSVRHATSHLIKCGCAQPPAPSGSPVAGWPPVAALSTVTRPPFPLKAAI